jgi:(p)ppGpp synthase/HD superfamily hydrolase
MEISFGKRLGKKDSARIEKAVHFISDRYRESGSGAKPVVLHSLEIGFLLLAAGASADAVIIAILHEVIGDSKVSLADIEKEFGPKVMRALAALSENEDIKRYEERYEENFARLLQIGGEVILVKMADMLHDAHHVEAVKDPKARKQLIEKLGYFLEMFAGTQYAKMHAKLKERYELEKAKFAREKKRKG